MRMTREVPQYVRDKISQKLTGRKLSDETRQKISDAQKAVWAKVPKNTNLDNKDEEETKI